MRNGKPNVEREIMWEERGEGVRENWEDSDVEGDDCGCGVGNELCWE